MWDDLTQEEIQRGYLQGSSSHHRDDEDNVALAAKDKKKKKFKKGSKDGAKQHDGEKKDMSKVKCFACQKMRHCWIVSKQEEEETTDINFNRD